MAKFSPSFVFSVIRESKKTCIGEIAYEQVVNIEVVKVNSQTTRYCVFPVLCHKNITH